MHNGNRKPLPPGIDEKTAQLAWAWSRAREKDRRIGPDVTVNQDEIGDEGRAALSKLKCAQERQRTQVRKARELQEMLDLGLVQPEPPRVRLRSGAQGVGWRRP